MSNNGTKETSKMIVAQKALLWGMFALIIALLIYTILDDIQRAFGIENRVEGVPYSVDNRNFAIIIALAIFWLFFLYFSTPSIKKFFNKLPQGLQFFMASAIFGCISSYFFYLVAFLILFQGDFEYFLDLLGLFVFATGIFSIVTSALICGLLNILNRFIKRDFKNVIFRISIVAGCVFSLILGSLVTLALINLFE